ncbi:GIN domain-containing protein [Niabella hibiscisoli]|uniref:GIN domain-containing protein n=1 Tax=Niabella hibiscisoli TaxID=1825928 RepID=UPI00293E6A50|nr:DUF2807 domain-containing protein [Niabella hibiscisoli]
MEAAFSGNVEFIQNASKSVIVKAADNLQGYIITEIKGNTLVLKTKPNVNIRGGSVTIYVSNPAITAPPFRVRVILVLILTLTPVRWI